MSDYPMQGPEDRQEYPVDHGAEESLLGAMIWDISTVYERFSERITDELFHTTMTRQVAHAVIDMHLSALEVCVVTVTDWLRKDNSLEALGGASRILELWNRLPNGVNIFLVEQQLKILEGMSTRRMLLNQSDALRRAALNYALPPEDALAEAEAALFDLHSKESSDGMEHISKIIPSVIQEIEETVKRKGHVTSGVATGFTSLDRMCMGLKPGVHYLAARPSKGKTAVMMQMALNVGMGLGDYPEFDQAPLPLAIFSLETNKVSLVKRGILNLAKLNMQRLRDGQMSRAQQQDLASQSIKLAQSQIYVEAAFGLSIQNFRVKARLLKKKLKLKMIMIDYLQLMTSSSKKSASNREREVAEISYGLSMAGHELGIPIVCLAQLNREGDVPRPKVSSLRESGQIEQDAQTISILCDAPEWASKDDPPDAPWKYLGIDVCKQKDGPTCNGVDPVVVRFDNEFYRLTSIDEKLFSQKKDEHQAGSSPRDKSSYDRTKGPRGRPRKDAEPPSQRLTADEFFGTTGSDES